MYALKGSVLLRRHWFSVVHFLTEMKSLAFDERLFLLRLRNYKVANIPKLVNFLNRTK